MQIVIDAKHCPCRELDDECSISGHECYEDDICSTCPLIRNGGIKLPKGHGRIADIDEMIACIKDVEGEDASWALALIECVGEKRTIIEADTAESEDKE